MSLWTVQQHEWLHALGHPVLLLAGDPALTAIPPGPTDAAASVAVAEAPPSADSGHTKNRDSRPPVASHPSPAPDRTRPATARRTPPANPMATPAIHVPDDTVSPPQAPAPRADAAAKKAALEAARGARRATRPPPAPLPADDPLLQAIARASGLDTGAFETAAQTWQIDLAQLRAEPSAKRALWQRMRGPRRNRDR